MYFSARLSKRNTEKPRRLSPRSPLSGVVGFLDRIGFLELVPYGLILLLIVGLMMLEPHMSGTILILAGAAAVQVGTANFVRPTRAAEIVDEIGAWCDAHGVASLDEIRGCV